MKTFQQWLENISTNLNLKTNKDDVLSALKLMEGDWILKQKGDYTIAGAIDWLNNEPDGFYAVYGSGGYNRYFVYPKTEI